jgi:hypothetical protein
VRSVGGKEFAESLAADVQRLLVTGTVRPVVRKKAALCLLRLFRRNPDVLNKEEWCAVARAMTVALALTGVACAGPMRCLRFWTSVTTACSPACCRSFKRWWWLTAPGASPRAASQAVATA